MKTIIYSINKTGFELEVWNKEISESSDQDFCFVVFNHGEFMDPARYLRAQLLDNLWFSRNPDLLRMYAAVQELIARVGADALVVDNCFPYHPEFLSTLPIHKVLRTSDGPTIAYDRDFAYVHAYDQILYHSKAYSPELDMPDKLRYVGATRTDFWPLAVFDAGFDINATEQSLLSRNRDIDLLFVGALHLDKMPTLARVKKAFGRRCRLHGLASVKKNVYFNLKYGARSWVRPIPFSQYIPLYHRTKIGFNVHMRGKYTVGGFRLFELPANGVMQISDGGEYLEDFYKVGSEIEGYDDVDELIDKIDHYLTHESDRDEIVIQGFRRTMVDHRIGRRMAQLGALIDSAIADVGAAAADKR